MSSVELQERVIDAVLAADGRGISFDELYEQLAPISGRLLRSALKELSRTGRVERVEKDVWSARPAAPSVLTGVLSVHGSDFVLVDANDVVARVLDAGLGEAIAGDDVVVEVTDRSDDGLPSGMVMSITGGPKKSVQGRVRMVRGVPVVELEDADELAWVPVRWARRLEPGTTRAFEVWGRGAAPRGVRGFPNHALIVRPALPEARPVGSADAGAERGVVTSRAAFASIRRGEMHASRLLDQLSEGMRLPVGFSREILDEVAQLTEPDELLPGDLDLRDIPLVTIDGADAKDFDDAVYAEEIGGEILLIVAVADVSHYVSESSELDAEAQRRGCSVYLPGRVYPMLPPRISDDLCSLRPHVPRRCAWVSILLRRSGEVAEYDAGFGLMRSWARLTYEQVESMLDGEALDVPAAVTNSVQVLERARTILYARRKERGLMDLDLPEPKIALTEDGARIQQIQASPRLRSHRLIEECMLLANETIADLLASRGWPAIYRVHAEADASKLQPALELLRSWGVPIASTHEPSIDELGAVVEKLAGDPSGRIFSFLVLRSLAKALYSTEESQHFGIGAARYVHFTSPIRRYPDLWVHRMLRVCLAADGRLRPADHRRMVKRLDEAATASNAGEKLATSAERYAQRLLRARLMIDRVGEIFDGVVSDVFPFGAFVTIESPFVDGLIPIRRLGRGWWLHDEADLSLVAEGTSERVRVGDRVRVRCIEVDMANARVQLERISSQPPERIFERLGGTPAQRRRAPARPREKTERPVRGAASGGAKRRKRD